MYQNSLQVKRVNSMTWHHMHDDKWQETRGQIVRCASHTYVMLKANMTPTAQFNGSRHKKQS